jgi:hypothetical protein
MAHATSTMIGSLIVLEGVGAIVFGAIAGALGVPAAYLLAGLMVTAAGLGGIGYARAHPQVLDLRRDPAGPPGPQEPAPSGPAPPEPERSAHSAREA